MKKGAIFFAIGFIGTFMATSITTQKQVKKGRIQNQITYSKAAVEKFYKDKYGDRFISVTEKTDEKKYMSGTINLDQDDCNEFYNKIWTNREEQGKGVSGTCGIVAAANLIDYYGIQDGFKTSTIKECVFARIEDMALRDNLTGRTSGTDTWNMDAIVKKSFKIFNANTNRSASNKTDMVRKKIRSEVNEGRICIIGLTDHYVVCCGLTNYEVKYYKNSKKKDILTENGEFFIINDGYGTLPGSKLFYSNNIANDYLYLFNGNHVATYVKGSK